MRWILSAAIGLALMAAAGTAAEAANGCPEGSYSVVASPDGSAISILFDDYRLLAAAGSKPHKQQMDCLLQVPLDVPRGTSLGLRSVDYRGFALLKSGQRARITIKYGFSSDQKVKLTSGKIEGPFEGDLAFRDTIEPRALDRAGCGKVSRLRVKISLDLHSKGLGEAMAAIDTIDSASQSGLVYRFDRKACSS